EFGVALRADPLARRSGIADADPRDRSADAAIQRFETTDQGELVRGPPRDVEGAKQGQRLDEEPRPLLGDVDFEVGVLPACAGPRPGSVLGVLNGSVEINRECAARQSAAEVEAVAVCEPRHAKPDANLSRLA